MMTLAAPLVLLLAGGLVVAGRRPWSQARVVAAVRELAPADRAS